MWGEGIQGTMRKGGVLTVLNESYPSLRDAPHSKLINTNKSQYSPASGSPQIIHGFYLGTIQSPTLNIANHTLLVKCKRCRIRAAPGSLCQSGESVMIFRNNIMGRINVSHECPFTSLHICLNVALSGLVPRFQYH